MRELENGCGSRRLGFAVPDLVACSLERPADMDLGGIKVDIRPGEPRCLATQPENEDQHVGRIQRVMIAAARQRRSPERQPTAYPLLHSLQVLCNGLPDGLHKF